jgi:hypothetical protein
VVNYLAVQTGEVMDVKFNSKSPIPPFMGHKPLKRLVEIDFYTGKIIKENKKSIEHIKPKSKGGASKLFNYAIVEKSLNFERGNMDLKNWFKIHPNYKNNARAYTFKYWFLDVCGIPYGKTIHKTLMKEIK